MPGELDDSYLSPWVGYYENRTPEPYTWMDDERQVRPGKRRKGKKKDQNKMTGRVIKQYLASKER